VSSANRAGHPRQQGTKDGLNFPAFPCGSGKKIEFDTHSVEYFRRYLNSIKCLRTMFRQNQCIPEGGSRETGRHHLFVAWELGIKGEAYARILAPTWRQRTPPAFATLPF
jgi:hypothetical protein